MPGKASPRLILICGLPGAGKTTLARQLADEIPAVRFCPDEWMSQLGIDLFDERTRDRLERQFWELTQILLRLGQSVILEFGFWVRLERDEKRLGARALGAAVELHYLNVPLEERWRRIQRRNHEGSSGGVPLTLAHLEQYEQLFQAPDREELNLFDRPVS